MLTITQEQMDEMLRNNHPQNLDADPYPVIRLFVPGSPANFLITSINQDGATFFGIADYGIGLPELGYIALSQILPITRKFYPTATPEVAVDDGFRPRARMSKYTAAAREHRKIVIDLE